MNVLNIDTQHPVLVTGANGYVAGWIVRRLLEAGVTVHAAVRNPNDAGRVGHLQQMADELARGPSGRRSGSLKLFQADLLTPGSYAAAMQGCRIVFHTASPFQLTVDDPQRDLVEPALQGTRNVLDSVNQCASVERVVLTSSCAAIYGDNADLADTPDGIFNESIWNTSSSLDHQPYSYSKTVAEREAWAMADRQSRWRLVVINPSFVIGPGITPAATSESFNLFRQFGDGRLKTGVPDFGIGAVDVRDVAEAHIRAAYLPEAEGRHVVSGHDTSFAEMARILRVRHGKAYPIPGNTLPKWLVWLVGPVVDPALTRRIVARNVGRPWRGDNRKSREKLGLSYRPLAESTLDFFQQLIDAGQFGTR